MISVDLISVDRGDVPVGSSQILDIASCFDSRSISTQSSKGWCIPSRDGCAVVLNLPTVAGSTFAEVSAPSAAATAAAVP